jgi:hypothetical protein
MVSSLTMTLDTITLIMGATVFANAMGFVKGDPNSVTMCAVLCMNTMILSRSRKLVDALIDHGETTSADDIMPNQILS